MADQGRKLDDVIVRQIRKMLDEKFTAAEICRALSLSRPTVKKIKEDYEEEKHGTTSISH